MKRVFLILYCVFLFNYSHIQADTPEPKIIMFVHGAWGGAWDYQDLEQRLEQKGHKVHRVTLTGLGERSHLLNPSINLDTHILDVINIVKYEDLDNIVLVGHSYGGMVITGVADRITKKIKHLVYMDAFLPIDGENALSLFRPQEREFFAQHAKEQGDGHSLPPFWDAWENTKDVAHPYNTFVQPISLSNKDAEKIPATYVLTLDEGEESDLFTPSAKRAKERGWDYIEWITDHNAQRSMPNEYVELLHNIK